MPDKRERPKPTRNLFYDLFADKYLFHYSMPYVSTTADFVQLDRLTRNGPLATRMTLEVFARGVENYFRSEHGVHTLKQLCSAFVPYWRNPLDRYGKPIEKASQVGAAPAQVLATWHPKFLAACWRVAQKDKATLDRITELMEEVDGLSEIEAFGKLKAIEEH